MASSRTTWVSQHQNGQTILDFDEAMMGWPWHQLDQTQNVHLALDR